MALEDPSQLDLLKVKKKPKYLNKKCVVDGIQFDSEKEARRWPLLQELERQGRISQLRRQVVYPLNVCGVRIAKYIADFAYCQDGDEITEDVKSVATKRNRAYRIKSKLLRALYGISITEV